MTKLKAAILNVQMFSFRMVRTIRNLNIQNQNIRNQNNKTFGFRMDSVFECSVFEPPL